jgi:rfaE bifunctional protein kinase chain/domain
LVVGDFFLDKYLIIDRGLGETSLETGLEAHQVVSIGCSPGAAGTVAANLRSLGVQVTALGVIGDDGEGYALLRELRGLGVDAVPLIQATHLFTPTYMKPRVRERDGREHEIERLDIKNRSPLKAEIQNALIHRLRNLAPAVDGIVVADQVVEPDCGAITSLVGEEIDALGAGMPDKPIIVDSRSRIGVRRNVMLKPNAAEAMRASGRQAADPVSLEDARTAGLALSRRTSREVFVTLGSQGVLVCSEPRVDHVPAVAVHGDIDIVGAGDSCLAGIVSSLCCGASPVEAAIIGNLVASITIQQIGATGVATREQVRARLAASSFGG